MRKPKLYQQFLLGLLFGLMLTPAPTPAQVGVSTVHVMSDSSPTSAAIMTATQKTLLEDLRHNIEEAKKWVEEFEHRAREIEHWVNEITQLKGILGEAEKLVSNNNNIIRSMSDLGQSVRGIIQLRYQVENMVRRRIVALKNIDDRLVNGVFNQDANLNDLEEYIRSGIGTASQNRLNNLERIAQFDVELQRWYEELQRCLYKKYVAIKQQKQDDETLKKELAKPDTERSATTIHAAQQELALLESYIEQLDKRISELITLITARTKLYKGRVRDMSNFAKEVEAEQKAWREYIGVNEEALQLLDDYQKKPTRRPQQ